MEARALVAWLEGDEGLDLELWRHRLVVGRRPAVPFGRRAELVDQLEMLAEGFVGECALLWLHAGLNVALRRGLQPERNARRFLAPWQEHADLLLEQAGDVGSFLKSNQMRPVAFFADAPAPGYKDIPLVKNSGFGINISQFRAIVMRAGTDAGQVKVLAAAIEKAAQSKEFKDYFADELAFADSFIPQKDSAAFLQRELKAIESNKS